MCVFYAKMPNSRFFGFPFINQNLSPLLISGCNPKLKNWALDCCWAYRKVSKMVCHNLIAQKLPKKIGSPEMDFCQIRDLVVDPLGSGHQFNNTTFILYWLWKFGQNSIFQSKVVQFMPTDRHTFCITVGGDKIFYTHTHSFCLWKINVF